MELISKKLDSELREIIRLVGRLQYELWPGPGLRAKSRRSLIDVEVKEDGSAVSAVDKISNKLLVLALRERFSRDSIYAEESSPPLTKGSSNRIWIVDPLDGTKAFLKGKTGFAIMLGLAVANRASAGYVYLPIEKTEFFGKIGSGAFKDKKRIRVSRNRELKQGRVCLRHCDKSLARKFEPIYRDTHLAMLDLACGKIDGMILKIRRHKEWDLAGPAAIIRAAGGTVTDESGAELKFKGQLIKMKYFVASNGLVHDALLDLLPS